MIPTSVTNSPPAAGLAQNGAVVVVNGAAAATVAVAATSQQQSNNNYSSIVLGLASLILEGRPIADDEYQQQQQQQQSQQQQAAQQMTPPTPPSSTVTGSSGRLSPRPSTSRAAINITTNPYAMASGTPRSNSQGYEYGQTQGHPAHGQVYGLGLGYGQGATTTSSSNSSSATHQRWTQKLCQLRQVSPAAQSMSVEPELVSLSINELNAERGDFEIVRRVMLNRAGVGGGMGGLGGGGSGLGGGASGELLTASNSSAGSSPGSTSGTDNILHSLQSLATTCLRGGPVMPAEIRPLSLSLGGFGSPSTAGTVSAASLLDYNCSRAGGGGLLTGVATGVAVAATTTTPTSTTSATASNDGAAASGTNNSNSSCASRPKHGPHCDQFLRKMGLAKGDAADAEEHFCDMSYINITCSRWRAHCLKMEAILARREPVCIEVYLGPAGHKILLEQWIISGKEKVPPPTMTLPSLCSAIRSQLYFSQIVAWCDLLRKGDPSVYESGRVIFANSSASNAGDLAGLSAAASSGGASTGVRRPRLNIFYRIRPHDVNAAGNNDGGFSGKANVHNFPHVNIAENFSVAVCVKSLPRINGGLPHIATPATVSKPRMPTPAASTPTGGGGLCAATPTGLGARIVISTTPPSSATGRGGEAGSSCDKRGERVEEEPAEDDLDGHRERQLLKYRKRMQRRDKKRERKPSDPLGEEPMDEGASEDLMTTLTTTAMPAAAATAAPTQTAMVMTLAPPRRIAMISTGTQTSLSSCQQCGSEKTLMCLNCADEEVQEKGRGKAGGVDEDEDDTSASEMEDTSSCSLSSSDLIVGTPRNKAELLLQAIQRTPKNRKPTSGSSSNNNNNTPKAAGNDLKKQQQQKQQQQNNNQHKAMPTAPAPTTSGCQVCKRQKTQHNFNNGTGQAASNGNNDSNSMEQEEEEQQEQHTKLTPNVKSCSLLLEQERCQTPPDAVDEHIVVQFKTPLSHLPLQQQQQQQQQLPLGKASNQLRLNCSGMGQLLDRETPPTTTMSSMLSPLLRKALPKVNLTTIFCSSAPVAIDSEQLAFCFEPSTLAYTHTQSQSLLTPPEVGAAGSGGGALSVQKSYSAPTLPNALSVSPRFAKQAAFYKRRSRHLSDRSDRSSLGSDEQLSDEDFESGMYSPAGSPLKTRARLATQFGCRPLLGNLEESLLQKRLLPKIEVAGFRLQLGASGGFCPTQLTIPASSYFYELHGETLSTPYLCEIRLPRKGYFVPRSGTVQATLLNPMGTVVRMFVIPYDMRDMPPLHRTFIRQRILAEELPSNPSNPCGRQQPERERETTTTREPPSSPTATSTTSKLGHFISAEQMKRLRYSIHLRFQTSRSGRLSLHTDIRLLISRRTDCDTAAAHAKGLLEAPNELVTDTLMPAEPRYSARQESPSKI